MQNKSYVIRNAVIAALGGFLFGFDTAVISGTTQDLELFFNLNANSLGFTVAIALIGTIIGSIVVGKPSDIYGRKNVLVVLAAFYAISALGSALADQWYFFLFYRFLGGLAVGGSSVLAPIYIAEISPAQFRGRLVAIQQFNVVFGILLAFLSNYFIASVIQVDAWRWMLGIETLPAVIFFSLLFLIPDSPRWLVGKNRMNEAKKILQHIGESEVEARLEEIKISLHKKKDQNNNLFQSKYRFSIAMAVVIAVFNQVSGINAILYYAPRIFAMTGLSADASLLQSIAIGGTNMLFTILAMFFIDKVGRRKLIMIGSVGMVLSLGMVAREFFIGTFEGYGILVYLIGFIAFFAFSQGAVIWVFISEIFPNKVRANGQALGSFTHWVMAALISWTFPVVAQKVGGGGTFLFFSLMMMLQFFWAWFYMPETKGKTLEQIEKDLEHTVILEENVKTKYEPIK